ncbi:MAG: FtsW/RodA/SpoVE family cell cycle protein [Thermomicrobiales bacterium]
MTTSRSRIRLAEIGLLCWPAAAAVVGMATIAVARERTLAVGWGDLRQALLLAAFLFAVSLSWTLAGFDGDQAVFPIVASLSVVGFLMIQRLQPDLAARYLGVDKIAQRHSLYLGAGLLVMSLAAAYFRQWALLRRYKYTLLAVCIALLCATLVFGVPINGARLWIAVGPFQAQPSELIKIGLVLFLAAYLDDKKELIGSTWAVGPFRLPPIPYLLPMVLMWGTSLLVLVVENDLGSAMLLFGIFLVMMYVATGRLIYVATGLVAFTAACWVAYQLFFRIGVRAQNWLDPWRDPVFGGFQQIQSEYAMAAGGVFGQGLGRGQPWRIPAVQTDYIFSAVGEELGLLGTLAVLSLFFLLVARGFSIALRSQDGYLRLVAIGLTTTIALQAVIIMGGVIRLIPLTGVTLPFVSYGGSSLLTNFLIVGLLLNISRKRT